MSKSKEQDIDEIKEDARYYGRVMIEYAKSQAIAFAEWMAEEEFEMLYAARAWSSPQFSKQFTTEQLYDLFIQSQLNK